MKKLFLLLFIIQLNQLAFSQNVKRKSLLTKNIKLVYSQIYNYTDSLFLHTYRLNKCVSGYMSLRFVINKGHIVNIETSVSAPKLLDSIFKEVLLRSNYVWGNEYNNKTCVLPVYYDLSNGCKVDSTSKSKNNLEAMLKKLPDGIQPEKREDNHSFLNSMNFDKQGHNLQKPINCVLLSPLQLSDPVIHERWAP